MPMYTPTADIPRDLREASEDVDDAIGAELMDLIPAPNSPYNVKALDTLAKDSKFAEFLDQPMDEAEVRIEIRGDGDEMEEEEEFDFASRMRR